MARYNVEWGIEISTTVRCGQAIFLVKVSNIGKTCEVSQIILKNNEIFFKKGIAI
jgi:hypothetical protein